MRMRQLLMLSTYAQLYLGIGIFRRGRRGDSRTLTGWRTLLMGMGVVKDA